MRGVDEDKPTFEPIKKPRYKHRVRDNEKDVAIRARDPNCRKKMQFTKNQIIARVAEAKNRGRHLRDYKCRNCRLYHLTSQT